MRHVLITNDFPPKIGGIQSYLFELWRRLPSDSFAVLTSSSHKRANAFDAEQAFITARGPAVLLPTRTMRRRADEFLGEQQARFAVLDPAVPLGMIGPKLSRPYVVVLHGAEVTVPARLPFLKHALANVLRGATHVISAGQYAADEASRLVGGDLPPVTVVPPGVDVNRFAPITEQQRRDVRAKWDIPSDAFVVMSHSRLVPRKGFDTVLKAGGLLRNENVVVLIAGKGRDQKRLEKVAADSNANARFLGRVDDDDLPLLLGASDTSAMMCYNRWFGLEQEGFGIVFLEAAACGIPQIAGRSGGASEAVEDGKTGAVVDQPRSEHDVAEVIRSWQQDPSLREELGRASRERVEQHFAYDVLVERLSSSLQQISQGVV